MNNETGRIFVQLQRRMQIFAGIAFIWLLAILVLGWIEFWVNYQSMSSGADRIAIGFFKMCTSLGYWWKAYALILFVWLGAGFFSKRLALAVSAGLLLLLVLAQALLILYFFRSLVPLGADLYGYSLLEIRQTAGASGGVPVVASLIMLSFLTLLFFLFRRASRTLFVPGWLAVLLPAVSLVLLIAPRITWPESRKYASEFDANLVFDKTNYFAGQSWDHFFHKAPEMDIYSDSYALEDTHTPGAVHFTYPDPTRFPFFHADSAKDVLSPFFSLPTANHDKEMPPNIVVILVEGLGRAFTNEGAYLGNFTPFIDSLSRHSLYWKNFLSEGGRTFAVLPSLLGSLPFGKNGFLELGRDMSEHLSLINILRANGYLTSFYYGGDAHFDNMDGFLRKSGIDQIDDGGSFPAGYDKLPAGNGFSWGYDDASLYRRNLDTRPAVSARPQLSIILTVATHSPFAINGAGRYKRLFERRLDEIGMDEGTKSARRAFKDQFTSILYADDALRGFFSTYAKRADYGNTLFIITGDHRMPEIPMRTKIDRYHVPLIIFSPLLKRPAEFESISTHFDITPSLLAFLGNAYGLRRPVNVAWLGEGLDTARQFRNIHTYPLKQTKSDLVDYIAGQYHLNGTSLFRLSSDLDEGLITDEKQQQRLTDAFAQFLRRNDGVIAGSKLMPDSALSLPRK
jgi:uncharacterized sulfatase